MRVTSGIRCAVLRKASHASQQAPQQLPTPSHRATACPTHGRQSTLAILGDCRQARTHMLTQIRNPACHLKRPNAEITLAIHRKLADKLERFASWNANPNSCKVGRTYVCGVVMIKFVNLHHTHLSRTPRAPVEKSIWLRSDAFGISISKYAARAGRALVAMSLDKTKGPKQQHHRNGGKRAKAGTRRSKRFMCARPHYQNPTCEPTSLGG